jgi:hypothetical protein
MNPPSENKQEIRLGIPTIRRIGISVVIAAAIAGVVGAGTGSMGKSRVPTEVPGTQPGDRGGYQDAGEYPSPWVGSYEYDVCVYGGTSGGVIAAYAAAARGKTTVIIEPGTHLGGMSSGGLSYSDVGDENAITGLALCFYARVGQKYGSSGPVYAFEPHVAEEVFNEYVQAGRIDVFYNRRLKSVSKSGSHIDSITVEGSDDSLESKDLVFACGIYIDASYEGDLMGSSGVTFVVGRESNNQYDELFNGVQLSRKHQFPNNVDPYINPGDPSSGLLHGINPEPIAAAGSDDGKVQAYNFRLCMTRSSSNQLPIPEPANYDPLDYELLGRAVLEMGTVDLRSFARIKRINPWGKKKYDWNNNGPVSFDYVGGSWDYPESPGGYAQRKLIWEAHKEWQLGYLKFLRTDSRIPSGVRNELATEWGLCLDEFVDTGGWPHQLYIREARRMIGPYVMTEHNCRGDVTVDDGIAFGSYTMDSHNTQRVVIDDQVKNEGDVQESVGQYPISYRSITPYMSEADNLLVPWSLSASHIAFGSIRMEPVFMALGQASGVAASMAIDTGRAVQAINVDVLRGELGFAPLPTGVGPGVAPQPSNYLDNNYPNPFNPTTTIRYGIKEQTHVSLKIYNVTGQLVKTLVSEVKKPAAEYSVTWDGRDASGNSVSSGVYFYSLTAGDTKHTKKMVLLK